MQDHTLILTTSYPAFEEDPSGHFVRSEARALAATGGTVTVLCPLESPPLYEDGVRVLAQQGGKAFGWPGVSARLREQPWRIVTCMQWLHRARAVLEKERYDRVIAHWTLPCGWPLAEGLSAPVELVSHGADVRLLCSLPACLRHFLVNRLVRRAEVWRFVSAQLCHTLCEKLPAHTAEAVARMAQIRPSPIDMPDVQARSAELRRTYAEFEVYVTAGRLVPSKQVDRVLAYLERIPASGTNPRILVVLGEGPERSKLERQAQRSKTPTLFLGMLPRHETLAWIAAADLFLHASSAEGMSTVLREAEALGTPTLHL